MSAPYRWFEDPADQLRAEAAPPTESGVGFDVGPPLSYTFTDADFSANTDSWWGGGFLKLIQTFTATESAELPMSTVGSSPYRLWVTIFEDGYPSLTEASAGDGPFDNANNWWASTDGNGSHDTVSLRAGHTYYVILSEYFNSGETAAAGHTIDYGAALLPFVALWGGKLPVPTSGLWVARGGEDGISLAPASTLPAKAGPQMWFQSNLGSWVIPFVCDKPVSGSQATHLSYNRSDVVALQAGSNLGRFEIWFPPVDRPDDYQSVQLSITVSSLTKNSAGQPSDTCSATYTMGRKPAGAGDIWTDADGDNQVSLQNSSAVFFMTPDGGPWTTLGGPVIVNMGLLIQGSYRGPIPSWSTTAQPTSHATDSTAIIVAEDQAVIAAVAAQPTQMFWPGNHDTGGDAVRNIQRYGNKLYFAYGDWNSNTGPIEAISMDLSTPGVFVEEYTMLTESTCQMKVLDGKLFIPYQDPREGIGNPEDGSMAMYDGTTWHKLTFGNPPSNPYAEHVSDVTMTDDGTLWACGLGEVTDGGNDTNQVWKSTDGGTTWTSAYAHVVGLDNAVYTFPTLIWSFVNDVYLVVPQGIHDSPDDGPNLMLHWDGSTWTTSPITDRAANVVYTPPQSVEFMTRGFYGPGADYELRFILPLGDGISLPWADPNPTIRSNVTPDFVNAFTGTWRAGHTSTDGTKLYTMDFAGNVYRHESNANVPRQKLFRIPNTPSAPVYAMYFDEENNRVYWSSNSGVIKWASPPA